MSKETWRFLAVAIRCTCRLEEFHSMAVSWPASSLGLLSYYYRRPRGSAWVFFFTVLVPFSPVLRFKISLGSRRGVAGRAADFGLSVSLAASPERSAVVL